MDARVKTEPVSSSESSDDSTSRSSSAEPSAEVKKEVEVKEEPGTSDQTSESEDSSGSSESESEEEKPNVQNNSTGNQNNDDGNESSSSESESEEEEPTPAPSQQPTRGPANTTVQSAQNFKPPSGFKYVKQQSLPSSETSSVLSNTRGKQIFHITAPASLPLSKVKEVSFAKVLQGEPVLTHDGVNYGIPPDSISQGDSNDQKLFLYDPATQMYYSSPAGNIQSYHVQELISLPTTQKDSASARTTEELAKPVKKQPKHLKMRFRPVGSSNGPAETIGSSSDESDGERPAFKMPKGSHREKEERKRKHHAEGEGSRKKSKKHSSPEMERRPSSLHKEEADGHHKSKKSSKHRNEKKRIKPEETC